MCEVARQSMSDLAIILKEKHNFRLPRKGYFQFDNCSENKASGTVHFLLDLVNVCICWTEWNYQLLFQPTHWTKVAGYNSCQFHDSWSYTCPDWPNFQLIYQDKEESMLYWNTRCFILLHTEPWTRISLLPEADRLQATRCFFWLCEGLQAIS